MNHFLLILHSWLRWLILIAAIWTIIRAISGMAGHKQYTKADGKSNLFFMIFMDVQFLIGIILYFVKGWGKQWSNISTMMGNGFLRFFAMEHVLMMIIALALVHIGRSSVKKATIDRKKHSRSLIFFGIALLIILAAIPWPFRAELGAPWFRF